MARELFNNRFADHIVVKMEKSNSEKNKNIGSRFIKGRKQDAIAEIEGWIAENRGDTTKGWSIRFSDCEPHPVLFNWLLIFPKAVSV